MEELKARIKSEMNEPPESLVTKAVFSRAAKVGSENRGESNKAVISNYCPKYLK